MVGLLSRASPLVRPARLGEAQAAAASSIDASVMARCPSAAPLGGRTAVRPSATKAPFQGRRDARRRHSRPGLDGCNARHVRFRLSASERGPQRDRPWGGTDGAGPASRAPRCSVGRGLNARGRRPCSAVLKAATHGVAACTVDAGQPFRVRSAQSRSRHSPSRGRNPLTSQITHGPGSSWPGPYPFRHERPREARACRPRRPGTSAAWFHRPRGDGRPGQGGRLRWARGRDQPSATGRSYIARAGPRSSACVAYASRLAPRGWSARGPVPGPPCYAVSGTGPLRRTLHRTSIVGMRSAGDGPYRLRCERSDRAGETPGRPRLGGWTSRPEASSETYRTGGLAGCQARPVARVIERTGQCAADQGSRPRKREAAWGEDGRARGASADRRTGKGLGVALALICATSGAGDSPLAAV